MRRFSPQWLQIIAGPHYNARTQFDLIGRDPSAPFPDDGRENAITLVEKAHKECVNAGLRASSLTASELLHSLNSGTTLGHVVDTWQELSRRVADELSCEYFLQLSIAEAERYENWQKGWEPVLERFAETARDVEEMNRCCALGRYTASMFHALHVAEWGAIALGDFIGVTDPKKGWGPTTKSLRVLVDGGHAELPVALAGNYDFLEQMNREVQSMAFAWRHKIDHAANHLAILPNTDFTQDVAEHVIGAVRIFMLRLKDGI